MNFAHSPARPREKNLPERVKRGPDGGGTAIPEVRRNPLNPHKPAGYHKKKGQRRVVGLG
jgi:hypothetical protein